MATGDVVAAGITISLTLVGLSISLFLVLLPLLMDYLRMSFSKNIFLHYVIRRSCFIFAAGSMMFTSTLLFSLAATATLTLHDEIQFYMWVFGWASILLIVWLVIGGLIDLISLWMDTKHEERYGSDD